MQQQSAHNLANGRAELPEPVAASINSAVSYNRLSLMQRPRLKIFLLLHAFKVRFELWSATAEQKNVR